MVNEKQSMDGFLQVQLLSMVNALKTGDPTLDMLLAMILPYLIGQFSKDLIRWAKKFFGLWFQKKKRTPSKLHERTITHRSQDPRSSPAPAGRVENLDKDTHNLILIKAIQLFVHEKCSLKLTEAIIDLTTIEMEPSTLGPQRRAARPVKAKSTSDWLKTCQFVERPMPRTFHRVGVFSGHPVDLWFDDSIAQKSSKNDGNEKSDGFRTIEIKLQSPSKQAIHDFIETAYKWYTSQLVDIENTDRYFFDLKSFDHRSDAPLFRRYVMSSSKTFKTLFSKACCGIKEIVDHFESKSGKYAIEGYPHKLGLMLSGEPGTGKTSLIKALAHHTGRHVVNIPLSKIANNSQLMSLMFNNKYQLPDGTWTDLDFKKVIFVLEDVDAESSVVKCRKLIAAEKAAREEQAKLEGVPLPSPTSTSSTSLNLTGLLNAFDGIVETPGRIVIMTSNHPEKLDRALTRPGRIDEHVVLGYMLLEDIQSMIEHYFEEKLSIEAAEHLRITVVQNNLKITPAKLERMIVQNSSLQSLLKKLRAIDSVSLPTVVSVPSSVIEETKSNSTATTTTESD